MMVGVAVDEIFSVCDVEFLNWQFASAPVGEHEQVSSRRHPVVLGAFSSVGTGVKDFIISDY